MRSERACSIQARVEHQGRKKKERSQGITPMPAHSLHASSGGGMSFARAGPATTAIAAATGAMNTTERRVGSMMPQAWCCCCCACSVCSAGCCSRLLLLLLPAVDRVGYGVVLISEYVIVNWFLSSIPRTDSGGTAAAPQHAVGALS